MGLIYSVIRWRFFLCTLASLSACTGAQDNAEQAELVDHTLTQEQAGHLIAAGEQLDTIPKSIWRERLSSEQFSILWEKETEKPFSGAYLDQDEPGVYVTAGCRIPVFHTLHQYDSGTGWPSFWEVLEKENVVLKTDTRWGIRRTEVLSACGEHLGHVFNDGPQPTGLRYCINSLALEFIPLAEWLAQQQVIKPQAEPQYRE